MDELDFEYANSPAASTSHSDDEERMAAEDWDSAEDDRIAGTAFSKTFIRSTIQDACRVLLTAGHAYDEPEEFHLLLSRLDVLQDVCRSEPASVADFLTEDPLTEPLVVGLADVLSADEAPPEPSELSYRLFGALAALTAASSTDGVLYKALTRLCVRALRWHDAGALTAAYSALAAASAGTGADTVASLLLADDELPAAVRFVLRNSLRVDLLAAVWRLFGRLFVIRGPENTVIAMLAAAFLTPLADALMADERHGASAAGCVADALLATGLERAVQVLAAGDFDVKDLLTAIRLRPKKTGNLSGLIDRLESLLQ